MGYELHITRRKLWSEKGDDIEFEEFVHHVALDAEFRHPGRNGNDYADWRSPNSGYESWLCWQDGQVHTKNPEPEFIEKLVAIARELHAKVQGDDGETYLSATEIVRDEAQASSPAPVAGLSTLPIFHWPLWKQVIAAFIFGCVLLALKLLLFGE